MRILRSVGKTCFAAAYAATRSAYGVARRSSARPETPFIICYHRVVEDFDRSAKTSIPSMLTSTRMLERHIDWVARRFSLVSLDEIGQYLLAERSFDKPPAAITFDDGYSDNYHHGFPLLKRKGIPAAVFVVSGLVGTGAPQLFDRLYLLLRRIESRGLSLAQTINSAARAAGVEGISTLPDQAAEDEPFRFMTQLLKSVPRESVERIVTEIQRTAVTLDEKDMDEFAPLSWDMIRKMHHGGITIGSHTKSHTLLTSESAETAAEQLAESKAAIEKQLQAPIRHFAYPDGRFNPRVVEAVNSTGYRFAYSICMRRDSRFPLLTIPRKVLWERACVNPWGRFSSSIMNCHAYAAFDSVERCEHDHSAKEPGEMNGTIN